MEDLITKYWAFIVFVVTGVFAWIMGQERNRYKINDLSEDMKKLETRLTALETESKIDSRTLVEVATLMNASSDILKRLEQKVDRLEQKIQDKADK